MAFDQFIGRSIKKGIHKNNFEKARDAGLKGTYPLVEFCTKCKIRKVTIHHYHCNKCWRK